MKLIKQHSPVLDCQVWTLRQVACGRVWENSFAVLQIEYERFTYPRNFLAARIRHKRRQVREAIAIHHQQEQASVRT